MAATVGLLGAGRMGSAMARALAAAGFDLLVWNRSPEPAERLASDLGARTTTTPADVARSASVCVSMLADGTAVDAVYGGRDGLLEGASERNVLVDCSTVPPAVLRAHEAAARHRGAGILDAPVSGSVALAETGKLTLMVGGEEADLERARAVLDAIGSTVFHLGPLGSGAAMKLAVNTAIFGLNGAVAECIVLAEAAGIPRATAYDVLAASAVGAPFVGYKRASFVEPDTAPVGFALELAAKDLRLIAELAEQVGVELPQAATNARLVDEAARALGDERDFSAVAVHLRQQAERQEAATG
jgi:3-hydroxyisobutyrate dehydrogenase/2-hydroxy-3-oxopropionate reductase